MFWESSTLQRKEAAHHGCARETGEEIGALQKLAVAVLSVVIAGGTFVVSAMPFALLHLR